MRRKKFVDISLFFVAVFLVGLTSAAPNKLKIFQNENLKNKLSDVEVKNIGEDDIQVYEQDKVKHVVVRIDSSENTLLTSTEKAEEQAAETVDEEAVIVPVKNVEEVIENSDDQESQENESQYEIPTPTPKIPVEIEPEKFDSVELEETQIQNDVSENESSETVEEEYTENETSDINKDETTDEDLEVVPAIDTVEDIEVTTETQVSYTVPDDFENEEEKVIAETTDRVLEIEELPVATTAESVTTLSPKLIETIEVSTTPEADDEATTIPIVLVKSDVEEQNSTEVTTQMLTTTVTTLSSDIVVPEIIEITTKESVTTSTTTSTTPVLIIETQPVLTTIPPTTAHSTKAPPSPIPKKAKVHHQKTTPESKPKVEEQSTSWFFDADGSWSWFGIIFILLFLIV